MSIGWFWIAFMVDRSAREKLYVLPILLQQSTVQVLIATRVECKRVYLKEDSRLLSLFFFRDMKKGMSGCNWCTHPTCPHSMNSNGLSSCLECDLGILVLDPSAAPKWKLGCNRCDVIIHLFENAHKVTVDTDTCDCGAQLVTVEYKQVIITFCINV